MDSKRIRLRDIAIRLGVSHTTVAMALRDHHSISVKRRVQVKRLAEKMGYRPDPFLTSLAYHRRMNGRVKFQGAMAWLRRWEMADLRQKLEYHTGIWRGAMRAAGRFGYRLEEIVWERDFTPKRYERILLARGIQGVLIPPHNKIPDWGDFDWSKFSIVRFGQSVPVPDSNLVTADQFRAVAMAIRRIHEYGYRRIGLVTDSEINSRLGGCYVGGFRWAQINLKLKTALPPLLTREGERDDLARMAQKNALQQWLDKYQPDAVLTTGPEIPGLIRDLGHRIPQDIAVAGTTIYDIPVDAGIDQHSEAIGRIAVETLVKQLNLNECGEPSDPARILVECPWQDGKSLPRRIPRTATENRLQEIKKPVGVSGFSASLPKRRITIYDIAKKLNVTHSTVALALHDNPRISAKRRAQVRHTAKVMGYQFDPCLSSLSAYRKPARHLKIRSTLAWIKHWAQPDYGQKFAYHTLLWRGASVAADRLGYSLKKICWEAGATATQFEQNLAQHNIQGVLISPHQEPPDWGEFDWSKFSIVRLGLSVPAPDANLVTADQFRSMVMAVTKINQCGYERIGLVLTEYEHNMGGNFCGGFLAAQELLHLKPVLPPLFLLAEIVPAEDAKEMQRLKLWVDRHQPDAILTTEAKVPRLIRKLGHRIPQDIAVAGTSNDIPVNAFLDQHPEGIGRIAVETLVKQINIHERGEPVDSVRILIESRWHDGSSLPPRR